MTQLLYSVVYLALGLAGSEIPDDYGEDSQHTSDFLFNEDSLSSIDIEFGLLEKVG